MLQVDYANKPSITTIKANLKKAVASGETWIQFSWGENQITIERGFNDWFGVGWLGRISGQDLADTLNH